MKTWTEWPGAEFVARPFSGRYLKPDLETCFAGTAGLSGRMASILANAPRQLRNISPGPHEIEISRRLAKLMGGNSTWPAGASRLLRNCIGKSVLLQGWGATPFSGVDNKSRDEFERKFGGASETFAQRHWGKSWNATFEEDYARDLTVNDLVQTGVSETDEAAMADIVEAAAGLLDARHA